MDRVAQLAEQSFIRRAMGSIPITIRKNLKRCRIFFDAFFYIRFFFLSLQYEKQTTIRIYRKRN